MIHTWNTTFDVFPSGADFGSVSGRVIREMKEAFYERFAVAHDITEGPGPLVTHNPGECSIVGYGDAEDEALRIATPQTLFWEYEAKTLYVYDEDSNPFSVATFLHDKLIGLDDDDHTQYAQDISDITGELTVNTITNYVQGSGATPYVLLTANHTGDDHLPGVTSPVDFNNEDLLEELVDNSPTVLQSSSEDHYYIYSTAPSGYYILGAIFTDADGDQWPLFRNTDTLFSRYMYWDYSGHGGTTPEPGSFVAFWGIPNA